MLYLSKTYVAGIFKTHNKYAFIMCDTVMCGSDSLKQPEQNKRYIFISATNMDGKYTHVDPVIQVRRFRFGGRHPDHLHSRPKAPSVERFRHKELITNIFCKPKLNEPCLASWHIGCSWGFFLLALMYHVVVFLRPPSGNIVGT